MTMYEMIRKILLFALLLGCSSIMLGQKVGTTSLQFLKVMPTARATALGDAYVSLATGSDAVFWNPGGLSIASGQELSTTLTLWLFDSKQSAISYSRSLGNFGSVGVQFQYIDFGEIEETRVDQLGLINNSGVLEYNPGLTGRTFSPKSYLIGISYARNLTNKFSSGFTVKYATEKLWDDAEVIVTNPAGIQENYSTGTKVLLFDFGMSYNTGYHTVKIGASVQNFGSQVRFAKEEYPAPLMFRLGVSGNLMGQDALLSVDEKHRITAAFDLIQPNDYLQEMHAGVEYSFSEILLLRTGYKFNYDSDGLTLGAGIVEEMADCSLTFDYSFGDMGPYLSNVHRLSLGVKFH
jgi:hypothetical protein